MKTLGKCQLIKGNQCILMQVPGEKIKNEKGVVFGEQQ